MSRVYFRRAPPDRRRVAGRHIRRVQEKLATQGLLQRGVDGVFGGDTEQALDRFQEARGIPRSRAIDVDTWTLAVSKAPPDMFERCLQITADFESHGFELVQGNFDGAGLTWGIVGFTLKSGEIGTIVAKADRVNAEIVDVAFGELAAPLREILGQPLRQQIRWADAMSSGRLRTELPAPWKQAFRRFGTDPRVQLIQLDRARSYWDKAIEIATSYSLTSELGFALAFDIAVQNGGVHDSVAEAIAGPLEIAARSGEREVRVVIGNGVADGSNPRWAEDVRERKLAIATGEGMVHKARYSLQEWGLDEYEVQPA
jgi:peptidoglycan hydrolase-like protein with peptidoglycan-binding domain